MDKLRQLFRVIIIIIIFFFFRLLGPSLNHGVNPEAEVQGDRGDEHADEHRDAWIERGAYPSQQVPHSDAER
jgi:hypothetical protein